MRARPILFTIALIVGMASLVAAAPDQKATPKPATVSPAEARLVKLKAEAAADIDGMKDMIQQMVDQVFSFAEPGFQEFESSKYLASILKKNGFNVEEGIAGMPTAFMATWGVRQTRHRRRVGHRQPARNHQKPGIPNHEPFVENAPGHGEGHNTGMPLSIAAALAVKKLMEREKLPGTMKVWPGIAEELLGGKAWLVRDGHLQGRRCVPLHAYQLGLRRQLGRRRRQRPRLG